MKNRFSQYPNTALITGASSGIGEAFACKLASLGFNVIIVARRIERLEKHAEEIRTKHKVGVIVVQADLSEENFLHKIINAAGEREIGIVINNAGLGSVGEFAEADAEHEIKMVKVNCVAPTVLTHHFLPGMIKRKSGAIIFLGSILSFQPTPFSATYSATKVFNSFLGDALWYELKKHNIDVLSLNPGGTDTEFLRLSKRSNLLIRTPEEVVETALKALSKKPSVIDGIINKIVIPLGRFLPRKILINLTGIISGILHQKREKKNE